MTAVTVTTRPPLRRLAASLALALALVASLAGCDLAFPPGEAPLRYRDDVFTNVTRTNGIVYGQNVNYVGQTQSLALDLYQPTGDTATSRPLIIWIHGGSFRSGTRTSPEIVDQANVFARKGYVNASITYRLTPNGCTVVTAECITAITHANEDARAAVRFFKLNAATYGVDPTRIAVAGTSAGAITALNVGFRNGPEGSSGNPGPTSDVAAAVSLSGAITHLPAIGAGDAPSLLFHGTADTLVPFETARNTRDRALEAGLVSWLVTWQGAGHVPYATYREQILDVTRNFLFARLDLG